MRQPVSRAIVAVLVPFGLLLPAAGQDKPDKPATVKVETGKLVVATSLKGTVESLEAAEVSLGMKVWTGPLVVKSAVPHGTKVSKGQLILELETQKIDQALSDARLERELSAIAKRQLEVEIPTLEQLLPLNLAAAEREKRIADEDLQRYTEVEREHRQKTAEFTLKAQQNYLEYAQEELKQLQRMYRDKDLTEETEEIILKRQRNQIEQIEFSILSQKLMREREMSLDLPRRDIAMQEAATRAALALQKAVAALPLELEQKRLALRKLDADLAKLDEKLKDLEYDRGAMMVPAPVDGLAGHGQADRGAWNTAAISNRLRPKGVLQPTEVVMTIVSLRPLSLRTDIEEKDLHLLKEGLQGEAVPVGFPDLKLPATIQSVALVPRTAGSFEARIALEVPENVTQIAPGMTANVKFTTYRNDNATLAPSSAIFRDEGSEESYVYVKAGDEPKKTTVKTGKSSGDKTEILEGVAAGTEILAAKP